LPSLQPRKWRGGGQQRYGALNYETAATDIDEDANSHSAATADIPPLLCCVVCHYSLLLLLIHAIKILDHEERGGNVVILCDSSPMQSDT
jgi:hypothetical protein